MSDESNSLPREAMLGKLLRMTASPNDGEALTAIRKANALLTAAGWDWDKLLSQKIVIVPDPFAGLANPFATRASAPAPGTPPPMTPRPPPPPPLRGTPATPISTANNRFPGFCHCCGNEVVNGAGYIFKVKPADTKYAVVCVPCNTSATVHPYAATPRRDKKKKSVIDLA